MQGERNGRNLAGIMSSSPSLVDGGDSIRQSRNVKESDDVNVGRNTNTHEILDFDSDNVDGPTTSPAPFIS